MTIVPQSDAFLPLEEQIARVKDELGRISREQSLAFARGRREEAARSQLRLFEAELRNVDAIASYVGSVSPSAARELASRRRAAARRFQDLRTGRDPEALRRWVKDDLAPLLGRVEQVAYVVATSLRYEPGKPSPSFAWKSARRP